MITVVYSATVTLVRVLNHLQNNYRICLVLNIFQFPTNSLIFLDIIVILHVMICNFSTSIKNIPCSFRQRYSYVGNTFVTLKHFKIYSKPNPDF